MPKSSLQQYRDIFVLASDVGKSVKFVPLFLENYVLKRTNTDTERGQALDTWAQTKPMAAFLILTAVCLTCHEPVPLSDFPDVISTRETLTPYSATTRQPVLHELICYRIFNSERTVSIILTKLIPSGAAPVYQMYEHEYLFWHWSDGSASTIDSCVRPITEIFYPKGTWRGLDALWITLHV